jgi:hypothetical protein
MADFNTIRNLDQIFRFITNPDHTEHEVLELQSFLRWFRMTWTCRGRIFRKYRWAAEFNKLRK